MSAIFTISRINATAWLHGIVLDFEGLTSRLTHMA